MIYNLRVSRAVNRNLCQVFFWESAGKPSQNPFIQSICCQAEQGNCTRRCSVCSLSDPFWRIDALFSLQNDNMDHSDGRIIPPSVMWKSADEPSNLDHHQTCHWEIPHQWNCPLACLGPISIDKYIYSSLHKLSINIYGEIYCKILEGTPCWDNPINHTSAFIPARHHRGCFGILAILFGHSTDDGLWCTEFAQGGDSMWLSWLDGSSQGLGYPLVSGELT